MHISPTDAKRIITGQKAVLSDVAAKCSDGRNTLMLNQGLHVAVKAAVDDVHTERPFNVAAIGGWHKIVLES